MFGFTDKLKKSSDLWRRSDDRGRRARPARARPPETPRWVGGRISPRAPPPRRRSAEKVTRATAWCVPPGSTRSEVFPMRRDSGTRPRVGVADACSATRPGSRPQAPAHARAIASPSGCVRVPRGSRAPGALPAPPNARAGPEGFRFSDSTTDARHQTRLRRVSSRVRRPDPTRPADGVRETGARAPRLANASRTKRRVPRVGERRRRTTTNDD